MKLVLPTSEQRRALSSVATLGLVCTLHLMNRMSVGTEPVATGGRRGWRMLCVPLLSTFALLGTAHAEPVGSLPPPDAREEGAGAAGSPVVSPLVLRAAPEPARPQPWEVRRVRAPARVLWIWRTDLDGKNPEWVGYAICRMTDNQCRGVLATTAPFLWEAGWFLMPVNPMAGLMFIGISAGFLYWSAQGDTTCRGPHDQDIWPERPTSPPPNGSTFGEWCQDVFGGRQLCPVDLPALPVGGDVSAPPVGDRPQDPCPDVPRPDNPGPPCPPDVPCPPDAPCPAVSEG